MTHTSARRRFDWVGPAVFLACALGFVGWICASKIIEGEKQQAAWDAASGEAIIDLGGTLDGEYYRVSSKAKLATYAEQEETALKVWVERLPSRSTPSKTPILDVSFGAIRCSTGRGFVWETSNGSMLTVWCDGYIPLRDLANVGQGQVRGW